MKCARASESPWRYLTQELAVSGLAAAAVYAAGGHAFGLALAALSVGYHALVYASGSRLLQPR